MTVPILAPVVRSWYCPACKLSVTKPVRMDGYHSEMHICPKMSFLLAPMLPAGTKGKLERHEPEDYVGRQLVRVDGNGRPAMNITTVRDDGQDVVVFAPTATATGD
jgi:hypothetical protein